MFTLQPPRHIPTLPRPPSFDDVSLMLGFPLKRNQWAIYENTPQKR